jgi:hypothetical protein
MSIATASDFELAPPPPLVTPLLLAAACVALADWLFYGWDVGISWPLFLGVLGVVAVAANGVAAPRKTRIIMTAMFVAGLLAAIEDVSLLSMIVSALTTALFVNLMTVREPSSWQWQLFDAAATPFRGPFQFAGDLLGRLRRMKGPVPEWLRAGSLVGWIIPLAAFAVFLGLFASANPLIEYRLMQIDLRVLFNALSPSRMAFWIMVVCAIWPVILRRVRRGPVWEFEPRAAVAVEPSDPGHLFGAQAILRSLVLFNALFALQSGLDLVYLWGGAALPGGMTHAEYAHRGAYPLVATALLAAGFVLVAMRPGGPAEQSRWIRPLVLLWTGQNILLVISSIFRLDLYIAAFSLTYLRLAAFIWMGLVAAGLLLILIQIIKRKSLSWLVNANAATLALVLYGCCFLNAPWLVAYYNVEHSREVGGSGPSLDMNYLKSLGSAQTLPPVEAHMAQFPGVLPFSREYRTSPDRDYFSQPGNWRGWNFRRWRLERYFANTPPKRPTSSDGSKG